MHCSLTCYERVCDCVGDDGWKSASRSSAISKLKLRQQYLRLLYWVAEGNVPGLTDAVILLTKWLNALGWLPSEGVLLVLPSVSALLYVIHDMAHVIRRLNVGSLHTCGSRVRNCTTINCRGHLVHCVSTCLSCSDLSPLSHALFAAVSLLLTPRRLSTKLPRHHLPHCGNKPLPDSVKSRKWDVHSV